MRFKGLFVAVFLLCFVASARAETFTAYLSGAQQVPAAATSATGYARIFVNESAGTMSFSVVFNGLSSAQTASHIHAPAAIGANAPVAINFGAIGGTSGTITGNANITPTQLAQLRAGQGYVNVHTSNFPGGEIRGQIARPRPVDNDGDGRTDYSVLRFPNVAPPGVSQITYWNQNSTSGLQVVNWGNANTDFPAPGDYDGDGIGDLVVYRAGAAVGAQSTFYILRSTDGTAQLVPYGVSGDQVIARDYDGDGRTDPAIFRRGSLPTDQTVFWIKRSTTNSDLVIGWGTTGDGTTSFDTPVVADYDGDGKADVAVYRTGTLSPANTYIIRNSSDGSVRYQQWGNFNSDYILPGDYDGDGKADFCSGRTGATGTDPLVWWILQSSNGQIRVQSFGRSTDQPTQGDYDGDGRTDLAIYRQGATSTQQSVFWTYRSLDGSTRADGWGTGGNFAVNTFDSR